MAGALTMALTLNSCLGSFAMVNKVKNWNEHVGGKFLNELIFIGLWVFPVYPISYVADLLVINSIEFWSGTNPITAETKIIDGKDAKYKVERDATGYTVTNLSDKSQLRFNFDSETRSWWINDGNNDLKLMEFVDDDHVKMATPGGNFVEVELSEEGLMAYNQMAAQAVMMAMK